jgi:Tfp pilus assembly protein PilO
MTATTFLASCAIGNVDCHDTASVDLLPLLVVVVLVVVALVALGIALLGRQRR